MADQAHTKSLILALIMFRAKAYAGLAGFESDGPSFSDGSSHSTGIADYATGLASYATGAVHNLQELGAKAWNRSMGKWNKDRASPPGGKGELSDIGSDDDLEDPDPIDVEAASALEEFIEDGKGKGKGKGNGKKKKRRKEGKEEEEEEEAAPGNPATKLLREGDHWETDFRGGQFMTTPYYRVWREKGGRTLELAYGRDYASGNGIGPQFGALYRIARDKGDFARYDSRQVTNKKTMHSWSLVVFPESVGNNAQAAYRRCVSAYIAVDKNELKRMHWLKKADLHMALTVHPDPPALAVRPFIHSPRSL